jgi:hypothetical protein
MLAVEAHFYIADLLGAPVNRLTDGVQHNIFPSGISIGEIPLPGEAS